VEEGFRPPPPPDGPGPEETRRIKQRGVLSATAGLLLLPAAALVLGVPGVTEFGPREWALATGVTLGIQGLLWAIPRFGLDRVLSRDRRYLYLPLSGAAVLLGLYVFLAPELRLLFLMTWFVALLYMAGLGGFRDVVQLSGLMTAVYLGVVGALWSQGRIPGLALELVQAGGFFLITVFAGVVFGRLRRERKQTRELRERLRTLAVTDSLTGLPNRRYFEDFLSAELERLDRYEGRGAVALIDVDDFKNYNDTLGHVAGDEVLQALADVFREQIRVSDVVARYGGEEFALIIINAEPREAREAAERLRERIEAHDFEGEDVQPGGDLTVSVGVACYPSHGRGYEELLERADRALYAAKREGKNRVNVVS